MRLTTLVSRAAMLGILAASTLSFVAPHAGTAAAAATTHIRVLHAVSDAPAVDVYLDGQRAVRGLAYPSETGYLTVPAGKHHVQVFASGTKYTMMGGVIDAAGVSFGANAYYTVAAIGTLKTIKAAVLKTAPASAVLKTKALVRFVHLAANTPAVDIEAKSAGILFANVAFPNASMDHAVPAGVYTLIVHPAGSKAVVLTVRGVKLAAGHVYTVYAIGTLKGKGMMSLSARLSDTTPMMMAGM